MRRSKPSSGQSLIIGIFLMLFGAAVWGLGALVNNGLTILLGVLLFVGGILLFFGGITGILDKL
jgi:drug/metabolite transporter (DMT)-like permease